MMGRYGTLAGVFRACSRFILAQGSCGYKDSRAVSGDWPAGRRTNPGGMGSSQGATVVIARVAMLIGIALTPVLAFLPPDIIPAATALIFALCLSFYLPYVGALFTREITRTGEIAGMCAAVFAGAFERWPVQVVEAKHPSILAPWLPGHKLRAGWRSSVEC